MIIEFKFPQFIPGPFYPTPNLIIHTPRKQPIKVRVPFVYFVWSKQLISIAFTTKSLYNKEPKCIKFLDIPLRSPLK